MKLPEKSARLAMEEGDRDSREALKTRSARRRLFADDDVSSGGTIKNNQATYDNENNRFLEESRQSLQQAKERWNFDFENEQPLPGRYEWIKANEDFPDERDLSTKSSEVIDKNKLTDDNKSEVNENNCSADD